MRSRTWRRRLEPDAIEEDAGEALGDSLIRRRAVRADLGPSDLTADHDEKEMRYPLGIDGPQLICFDGSLDCETNVPQGAVQRVINSVRRFSDKCSCRTPA